MYAFKTTKHILQGHMEMKTVNKLIRTAAYGERGDSVEWGIKSKETFRTEGLVCANDDNMLLLKSISSLLQPREGKIKERKMTQSVQLTHTHRSLKLHLKRKSGCMQEWPATYCQQSRALPSHLAPPERSFGSFSPPYLDRAELPPNYCDKKLWFFFQKKF